MYMWRQVCNLSFVRSASVFHNVMFMVFKNTSNKKSLLHGRIITATLSRIFYYCIATVMVREKWNKNKELGSDVCHEVLKSSYKHNINFQQFSKSEWIPGSKKQNMYFCQWDIKILDDFCLKVKELSAEFHMENTEGNLSCIEET